MMFCAKCGNELLPDALFCAACGTKTTPDTEPRDSIAREADQTFAKTFPPGSSPAQAGGRDAEDNKLMAILAYIGILFIVPLLVGAHKTSAFAKYHTNQGIVLFIADVIWSIAYTILAAIFSGILFTIGAWGLLAVVIMILRLLWLVPLAFCILGIYNAATGKCTPLPVIGKFIIIK
ncbi:MAG: zinc-ribbon domain-containing protein [Clostridiales Family XIII bacterium]|jgi:uncharacterized membrane protein|nr:zinc-ribbon domain-containing protein [Clostridiales Family XIII bacterium]